LKIQTGGANININITAVQGANNLVVYTNDSANNINSSLISFTANIPPSSSNPSSSSGGSSGGSGGFLCNNIKCARPVLVIMPGSSEKIEFPSTPVKSIELFAAEEILYAVAAVEQTSCNLTSQNISLLLDDAVYGCLKIEAGNVMKKHLERVSITFFLNKSWIVRQNLIPATQNSAVPAG